MQSLTGAICWASAIMLLAIGNWSGLIADDNAQVMFGILPVIAVLSMSASRNCLSKLRATAR